MGIAFEQLEFSERWFSVNGYQGLYEVSDFGRVRSVARTVICGRGGAQERDGRLLRFRLTKTGYATVHLCKDGKAKNALVHKLVALAFIGTRPIGHHIDHADGNRLNNTLGNLEYVSARENVRRSRVRLGNWSLIGEAHQSAKLSDADVMEVRRLYTEGMKQRAIAKHFGISPAHVCNIIHFKERKHQPEDQS